MLIHYEDGTFVTLHLGDLDGLCVRNDICWIRIGGSATWLRSPFKDCCVTKDYLLSKSSTNAINLDDADDSSPPTHLNH